VGLGAPLTSRIGTENFRLDVSSGNGMKFIENLPKIYRASNKGLA